MSRLPRWILFCGVFALLIVACTTDVESPVGILDDQAALSPSTCVLQGSAELVTSRIGSLQSQVEDFQGLGLINSGQARGLDNHLRNALRSLEESQYCAVQAQLGAFRSQLEELVDQEGISDRDAYDLRHAIRLALSEETYQRGDPEEYAPGATGEIRTVAFEGEELTVIVIDGLAIFNGDIILGFADELDGSASAPDIALSGPCHRCTRWSGTVGFEFANDWGDAATNAAVRSEVVRAINHWRAVTGLEFEQRATGEHLIFRNSMGCSSMVGRQVFTFFDPQTINISAGCGYGAIVHEIGHAIGIWHEQSRTDRDDYITVNFDAIRDGLAHNFEQFGGSGLNWGAYDFGSIMHYGCADFRRADAMVNPIVPIAPGVTCAGVGQRDSLSTGDISGIYRLYPPVFSIVGASPGDVSDRFELSLLFDSEAVNDDYIRWGAAGLGFQGSGPTFSTLDAGLPDGTWEIYAEIWIADRMIARRSMELTILNTPPVVDLGPTREVELNRLFTMFADVTDAEDGSCPTSVCSYEWWPVPLVDRGATADYRYAVAGARQISVSVTDGAGLSDTAEVTVIVVNSPPSPAILTPASGALFSSGATVTFSGLATDPNVGPGPEDGELACDRLHWTSSDLSDAIGTRNDCSTSFTFGNPGPRTITLRAIDPQGLSATTSITVEVEGCGATGCAPDVVLEVETAPTMDGSQFSPAVPGSVHLLGAPIEFKAIVSDVDGPPTAIGLEWEVVPPCLGGCSPIAIGSTGLFAPNTSFLMWTPTDDLTPWSNCSQTALPHIVRVTATDSNGNSRTATRTIYLACGII